jgi:hypothetical protein
MYILICRVFTLRFFEGGSGITAGRQTRGRFNERVDVDLRRPPYCFSIDIFSICFYLIDRHSTGDIAMKTFAAILLIISGVGLIGGITLWLMAASKASSDEFHFRPWRWKVKREWFRPPGYQLYIASGIVFLSGCISGTIYWGFLA